MALPQTGKRHAIQVSLNVITKKHKAKQQPNTAVEKINCWQVKALQVTKPHTFQQL
jgi:hypothetical protein